eukprot:m.165966 g.165966  ORF g.165966 m.165966 type:complete len:473 (+) comp12629_c0_seq1:259-1677(+)
MSVQVGDHRDQPSPAAMTGMRVGGAGAAAASMSSQRTSTERCLSGCLCGPSGGFGDWKRRAAAARRKQQKMLQRQHQEAQGARGDTGVRIVPTPTVKGGDSAVPTMQSSTSPAAATQPLILAPGLSVATTKDPTRTDRAVAVESDASTDAAATTTTTTNTTAASDVPTLQRDDVTSSSESVPTLTTAGSRGKRTDASDAVDDKDNALPTDGKRRRTTASTSPARDGNIDTLMPDAAASCPCPPSSIPHHHHTLHDGSHVHAVADHNDTATPSSPASTTATIAPAGEDSMTTDTATHRTGDASSPQRIAQSKTVSGPCIICMVQGGGWFQGRFFHPPTDTDTTQPTAADATATTEASMAGRAAAMENQVVLFGKRLPDVSPEDAGLDPCCFEPSSAFYRVTLTDNTGLKTTLDNVLKTGEDNASLQSEALMFECATICVDDKAVAVAARLFPTLGESVARDAVICSGKATVTM